VSPSRCSGLAFGFERFGDNSAVGFFEKYFDYAFGLLELFLALGGERDAFLEKAHGVVEGKLRALEFADNLFKSRKRAFEIGFLRRVGFFGSRCIHAMLFSLENTPNGTGPI